MQHTTHQRRIGRFVAAAALCLQALLPTSPAHALEPGDIVDLRVLVLSANGYEPTFQAWTTALAREGVPFDTIIANSADPITSATLAVDATHARYQAVILATGGLIECTWLGCYSALDAAEWAALDAYQARFDVRRVIAYAYPTPEYGLNWPFYAGDTAGTVGTLTAAGHEAFANLVGNVPVDVGTYGYFASPIDDGVNEFTTLVAGPAAPDGAASAIAGVHEHAAGFEELVLTIDSNAYQLHAMLLAHGLIDWVTKGVRLGYYRNYFMLHIDDIFLGDDRWDIDDNTTYEDDGATNPIVRMNAADVDRARAGQAETGLKLDMVYNGAGHDEAIAANGSDPLSAALFAHKSEFRWINHTYTHMNLNFATQKEIVDEIKKNISFAKSHGISINAKELVTGEHSGLANPNLEAALRRAGIRWIAADNSYQPTPYSIGRAVTVPRHPSNVYYNVGTFAEQLDEYNYLYYDNCTNTATTTCLTSPATWAQYVDSEATIMFRHLLDNDPRPHYFHQANLAEDGTLYPVVNEVLARYTALLSVPLLQPTFAESSKKLAEQAAWAANQSGPVAERTTALMQDGAIYVTSPVGIKVPITGAATGSWYGGEKSLKRNVSAGYTRRFITDAGKTCPKLVNKQKLLAKLQAKLDLHKSASWDAYFSKRIAQVQGAIAALDAAMLCADWPGVQ